MYGLKSNTKCAQYALYIYSLPYNRRLQIRTIKLERI